MKQTHKANRPAAYHDISVEDLPGFMQEKHPVVLDMRDAATFNGGHLDGALPADEQQIRRLLKKKSRPVLVYCYHGHSSRELAEFLCQMGLTEVYNLEGGWQALYDYLGKQSKGLTAGLREWLSKHGFRGESNPAHVIHARIDRAMTPLMLAALDGETDIASELLDLGADLDGANSDGNQALWFACVSAGLPMMRLLIAAGADLNHCNLNGYTCLMYAASSGKLQVVDELLRSGADATVRTPDGLDALEFAATLPVLKRLKAVSTLH